MISIRHQFRFIFIGTEECYYRACELLKKKKKQSRLIQMPTLYLRVHHIILIWKLFVINIHFDFALWGLFHPPNFWLTFLTFAVSRVLGVLGWPPTTHRPIDVSSGKPHQSVTLFGFIEVCSSSYGCASFTVPFRFQ